jgi:hypothetical protein
MTRHRSNAPDGQGAQQLEAEAQEAPAPQSEAPQVTAQQDAPQERRYRRPDRGPQARRDDQSRDGGPPREGGQQGGPRQGERRDDGRQGSGGRERSGRRRPGRARQQIQPITGEVLKPRVPITGDRSPVVKRQITEIDTPDGPVLGCPMLTRTRLGLPFKGGNQAPRCALAWALHSETEASYCMETPDLTDCWKVHPERLDQIRERLAERAAD